MPTQDKETAEDYFPVTESFTDFVGRPHVFVIELMTNAGGCFLQAAERNARNNAGYQFAAYSPVDPFQALGLLRAKIRNALSTRYLAPEDGHLSLTHDRLQGHISFGGIVVDGQFISYEAFCSILGTYEGFRLSLTISDPYDTL